MRKVKLIDLFFKFNENKEKNEEVQFYGEKENGKEIRLFKAKLWKPMTKDEINFYQEEIYNLGFNIALKAGYIFSNYSD